MWHDFSHEIWCLVMLECQKCLNLYYYIILLTLAPFLLYVEGCGFDMMTLQCMLTTVISNWPSFISVYLRRKSWQFTLTWIRNVWSFIKTQPYVHSQSLYSTCSVVQKNVLDLDPENNVLFFFGTPWYQGVWCTRM